MNILRTLTMFMRKKYDTIQVDSDSGNIMLQRSKKHISQEANDALDAPITMDELHIAVEQGKTQSTRLWWNKPRLLPTYMGDNPIWHAGNNEPNVHGRETDGFTKTGHNCTPEKNTSAYPARILQATHPPQCTMGTGYFPGVNSGRCVTLTPHLLLVP